ncbi:uncharacterized protein LOC6557153 [Drosophila grimshawi]|uniref:GH14489 n=1 Tax=Drosophila grimshawi TaxID=7222 RepID=B4J017_DROGR|nr:uncharacterized protein LOC6557153 [Drosophila grimshawi]EDV97810.1 GH14489 [Drosophila grimshawi]
MNKFWIAFFVIAAAIEIKARESIKPAPEVGQIIGDIENVHVEEVIQRGAPCTLNIDKDLPRSNLQPLYLQPDTDAYWLPKANGHLEIPRGASIELYCIGHFANVSSDVHVRTSSIRARCLEDKTFDWAGGKRELRDFICAHPPFYTVERMEQQRCGDGDVASVARIYRVGYNISAGRFVRTLELCHDAKQLRTHYALHQLQPANEHFQHKVNRVKFSAAGHFPGYDMAYLYSPANQQKRVAQLCHDECILNTTAGLFLTRGHLVAKADLIYASQQRSSFNYLNVAPQWQSFNGGHWTIVEEVTRRFVAHFGLSVSVYTGVHGVMPLPNAEQTSFHLATDASSANNGVLAVPRLYYRVLIDNDKPLRGLAFVGVNNPYASLEEIRKAYVICDPVELQFGRSMRWLQHKDLKKGYVYACRVSDLALAVRHLPPELQKVHELLGEL